MLKAPLSMAASTSRGPKRCMKRSTKCLQVLKKRGILDEH